MGGEERRKGRERKREEKRKEKEKERIENYCYFQKQESIEKRRDFIVLFSEFKNDIWKGGSYWEGRKGK